MTNPTPHGQVPEALPAIQRFEVVDCLDSEHIPAVIPKPHGPWVRYEDHVTALKAAQPAGAPQPDTAYAALPDAPTASDAMVDAYLKAQREAVEEADRFGRPNIGGLHTNTVREACRAGLNAALEADCASRGQAPAQAAPAYKDSTPELHVGDSAFESWYSAYNPSHKSDKQRARDAYAAGMVNHKAQAIPGVQWQCGPQASGFTAPQADSQPASANTRQIAECYGDCPEDPKTCRNQCKFEGRAARAPADIGAAPAGEVVAGIEAAAKLLERKADDFARENGSDDLGSLSFGRGAHADAKLEYHSTLLELAEEIRSLAPPPPTQAADSVLEDAARWQALPAFFEEYQIDAMKLYRDIDAYLDAARKQGASHD